MMKKEQLYEGKAKKVFATDDPALVIVSYKDDATALDGLKKGTITGKGVVNNRMSDYLFTLLEKEGIPTHFVKELNEREALVKKVSIVPLEVIVRNISAGSLPSATAWRKALYSHNPPLNSPTKTTTCTTRSSMNTMHLRSALPPRKKLKPSKTWLSASTKF